MRAGWLHLGAFSNPHSGEQPTKIALECSMPIAVQSEPDQFCAALYP